MTRQPRAHHPGSPAEYPPGDYDFDGISFSLPNPLISSVHHSVSGYATSSSILAVVSDPIPLNTIFIDGDTQNLLQITKILTTDNNVVFYNVTLQNPLAVFTNLRMRTTANGISCSTRLGPYESDQCGNSFLVNWDKNTNMPIPKEVMTGLSILLGSRIRVTISFDFFCRGLKHIGLDYAFRFNGTVGAGVKIQRAIARDFEIEPSYCYDVFTRSVDLGLFELGAAVQACVGIGVKRVDIQLPKPVFYYRTWLVIAENHGSIATTGMDFAPFRFDITGNRNSDFNTQQVFEAVKGIKFILTPQLETYIEVRLSAGPLLNYFVRVGLTLRSEWNFQLNSDKCPCPYLYGGTSTSLYGFFAIPALEIYKVQLIPEYTLESPLFQGQSTDQQCIFSSGKSREGSSELLIPRNLPAYIFDKFQFSAAPNLLASKVYVQLQAIDASKRVYENYAFAPIPWDASTSLQKRAVAATVVIRLTSGGKIRWHGSHAIRFIPRNEDLDADLRAGTHTGKWSKISTDVSYNVVKAESVEIFKEFTGMGTKYVSFQPNVPEGSVLGAIVHSVNGEEYKTAVLKSVIDDTEKTTDSLEFVGKAEVTITLAAFKILINTASAAKLEFYRDDTELLVLTAADLTPGISVSGERFDFSGLDFDLAGKPRLKVRVGVATSKDDKNGQEDLVVFEYRELSTGTSFSITKKTTIFEAEFRFTRSQPNVIFEFPNQLTPESRAIICRILRVEGNQPLSIDLPPSESYGIVRFAGLSLPSGSNVHVLVSMPGLTPLCTHRVMNTGDFLIPVNSSTTLRQTYLQVPFRRDLGSWSGKLAALGVFKTTSDATCGTGVEISAPGNRFNIGCLEPVVFNQTMSDGWVSLPAASSARTVSLMGGTTPDRGTSIEGATFKLHIYETQRPDRVNIYPSFFTIPTNTVFLELDDESVAPFARNQANVTVECPRASSVVWECGQMRPPQSGSLAPDPKRPGKFTGVPDCRGSGLQFIAKCRDSSKAFCEFPLAVPQVSLLRYRTAAGLTEVGSTVGTGRFLPGVTRQVVQRRVSGRVFKNWEGPVEIEPISSPGVLKITATTGDTTIELSVDLDGLQLPFSAEKYYANPSAFFGNLSIRSSTNGYPPDVAYFTDRGTVVANSNYYDEIPVRSGILVGNLLDLPKSFVLSQVYGTAKAPPRSTPPNQPQGTKKAGGNKLTTPVIIGIAVGGFALVVIVVVVIVIVRNRKKKSPTYSSDSEKSSGNSQNEELTPGPQPQ